MESKISIPYIVIAPLGVFALFTFLLDIFGSFEKDLNFYIVGALIMYVSWIGSYYLFEKMEKKYGNV